MNTDNYENENETLEKHKEEMKELKNVRNRLAMKKLYYEKQIYRANYTRGPYKTKYNPEGEVFQLDKKL